MELKNAVAEMKANIDRVCRMTMRGALTPEEAETRIIELIDNALPREAIIGDESWRRMEQRRLAMRRMWRFLLEETSEANERAS